MIHVGCCGFPKSHAEYFETFQLIEIQKTFYKPPMDRTAQRWREEAPSGFAFVLKAWQLITHTPDSPTYRKANLGIAEEDRERYGSFQPTDDVFEAWGRTRQIATILEAPIVVFQCPPSFTPAAAHKENMRAFFGQAERGGVIFAWEPRGDWQDEEIARLCGDLDLVHCVDPFKRQPVTAGLAYFRLHGRGGYTYDYSVQELGQVLAWCRPFDTAYVLFNNSAMWEDAQEFQAMIAEG